MDRVYRNQLSLVALASHIVTAVFPFATAAGLFGVIYGVARSGECDTTFYDEAINGLVPLGLAIGVFVAVYLGFQALQSRRESLDLEQHYEDEDDRPHNPY